MKMKPGPMDCKTCGKENKEKKVVIFGPPEKDVPFSMNGGKGVICLECYEKKVGAPR
jgi:hypothetical protein